MTFWFNPSGTGGTTVDLSTSKVYQINIFGLMPDGHQGVKLLPAKTIMPGSMMSYQLPDKPSKLDCVSFKLC